MVAGLAERLPWGLQDEPPMVENLILSLLFFFFGNTINMTQ